MILNVNFKRKHVTQIKNGIRKNGDASVKDIARAKTITFGTLFNVFMRMVSIQKLSLILQ